MRPSPPSFRSLIPEGPELAKFFYGRGFWDMECSTSFSERAKGHMSELPWLGPPLSADPPEETCKEATPAFQRSGRGSSQIYHRKVCIAEPTRLADPSLCKRRLQSQSGPRHLIASLCLTHTPSKNLLHLVRVIRFLLKPLLATL